MENVIIQVAENNSEHMEATGLVLTVRHALGRESDITVGFPGTPNERRRMATGDALLYETLSGTFDIRVLTQNSNWVRFLVTHISPRPGIGGAFVTSDPNNAPFTQQELEKIALSIDQVKIEIGAQSEILPEQIALIHKKLDEIKDASTRLGRKDWINYSAGAITSTCASAAFAPDVTMKIYSALNSAFSWLFSNALLLLQ